MFAIGIYSLHADIKERHYRFTLLYLMIHYFRVRYIAAQLYCIPRHGAALQPKPDNCNCTNAVLFSIVSAENDSSHCIPFFF